MFWIIITVIIITIGIVLAIYNKDGMDFMGMLGLSVVLLCVGVSLCAFIGGRVVPHDETYDLSIKYVYSIDTCMNDETPCYLITTKTESGEYNVESIDVTDAVLFDDEKEQPYIKTLYKRNSNPVVRFFWFTYVEKYEIHVSYQMYK